MRELRRCTWRVFAGERDCHVTAGDGFRLAVQPRWQQPECNTVDLADAMWEERRQAIPSNIEQLQ